nr:transcriptional regulator NrdR [bacterium]
MRCPFCGNLEDRVIDSRVIKNGDAVRRRRQCLGCDARFTSYETVEEIQLRVIKKDGRRELFDPAKIRNGIIKACEKRPVSLEVIDQIIERIEDKVARGSREVPTREIGEAVIDELYNLDEVA